MNWDSCYHYNNAGTQVWALVIRSTYDSDEIPNLPEGQWWVTAIAVNNGELLNCSSDCDVMKVVRCKPTQQVNTVVTLNGGEIDRTIRNHNKRKRNA